MRVLFIYSDFRVRGGEVSYHLGIGRLSAILKKYGHQTDLFHMYNKYDPKGLLHKIKEFDPNILAYSSMTDQFKYTQSLMKETSKLGIYTILGGNHATLVPECIEEEGIDAICRGEGEYALLEFITRFANKDDLRDTKSFWVKQNGKIYKNSCRPFIQDLDELPFGDRAIFDYQKIIRYNYDRVDFMASRGCPYRCTYCCNSKFREVQEGRYVRYRSVRNLLQEIKEVVNNWPAKTVFLQDDTFTFKSNKKMVLEFCRKYKEEIGLPLMVHTRSEDASYEMFQALKEAGCYRIAFGVESGNEELRRNVLKRDMSNEEIKRAFKIAKDCGLIAKSFNMVGLPGETKEKFQDTIDLNIEIKPDIFTISTYVPYPTTPLYEFCQEKGYLTERFKDKNFMPRIDTTLNLPDFSPKEILNCYRNFGYNIYKQSSWKKAIIYKVYYSRFGEIIIRLLGPLKKLFFRLVERPIKKS